MADRKKNPFPPGTARYREWNRKNKNPRRVAKKPRDETNTSIRNRRQRIDEAVEQATQSRVDKMRKSQSTDDSNNGNFS